MKYKSNRIDIGDENAPVAIPIYIINLKKRRDRKEHIVEQFKGRKEFTLHITEAFEHPVGAQGLWKTIQYIIRDLCAADQEFIVIGEDDLEFTENYSATDLFAAIAEAKAKDAGMLLGGVSAFEDAINISERLYWVSTFSGLHFTIIFNKFFKTISEARLEDRAAVDHHLATLSDEILFVHPFFAVQKDFGYSDVTAKNNTEGRLKMLFYSATRKLTALNQVNNFYKGLPSPDHSTSDEHTYEDVTIPVFIIHSIIHGGRLEHVRQQFRDKPEFDVQIIEDPKCEQPGLASWLSARKAVDIAKANGDDVIIICQDDHQFTEHYSNGYLVRNIIEAYEQGARILSGGSSQFHDVVPITKNRFWVDNWLSAQFIVVFRECYSSILNYRYDQTIVPGLVYSKISTNKMLLYPFISIQKDFGDSGVTAPDSKKAAPVTDLFRQSELKLERIQNAYSKYQLEEI